jgi:catechol 2,3-dioxygenase-like lactoylglutathione lyase family enzyme
VTASSIKPLALDHISLTVRDLDRSLAFYEGLLGLERLPRPEMSVAGVWLSIGSAQVHLIVHDESRGNVGTTPTAVNPAAPHLAMAVADYDTTVTVLEEAGLTVVGIGSRRGQCWVQDPDGYVIEFIKR